MKNGKTDRAQQWVRALLVLGIGLVIGARPSGARAENLSQELFKQAAPQVIEFLKKKECTNVGVLKFRVKKGDDATSDHVGPLNLLMANRMELALVLADTKDKLGIIHNASTVASRLPGANHLTKEGRQVLFQGRYPLAWGSQEVSADAFVTGFVKISPDLKDMSVTIIAFTKDGGLERLMPSFQAPLDPVSLIESGESFLLRGAFDQGLPKTNEPEDTPKGDFAKEAVASAVLVKTGQEKNPILDKGAPITLGIFYDGSKVPLEIKDGKAQITEPDPGQAVTFSLENTGSHRYAVVLKVNGSSTLFKERLPDLECRKWVLEPGEKIALEGFQTTDASATKFKVFSLEESKAHEVNYGEDTGIISLTVFQEGKASVPILAEDELLAIDRGVFSQKTFKTRDQFKTTLLMETTSFRSLIEEGTQEVDSQLRKVTFKPGTIPVMLATIIYHKKG